jgi:hypothetical protein
LTTDEKTINEIDANEELDDDKRKACAAEIARL